MMKITHNPYIFLNFFYVVIFSFIAISLTIIYFCHSHLTTEGIETVGLSDNVSDVKNILKKVLDVSEIIL